MTVRIKKREILTVALMLAFVEPTFFYTIPILDTFFTMARLLAICIVAILVFGKKIRINKIDVLLIIYYGILMVSQMLSENTMCQVLIYMGNAMGFVLLLEIELKRDSSFFIKSLGIWLRLLVCINFALMMIYPEGMYTIYNADNVWHSSSNWLLGYRNAHIYTIIPATLITIIEDYIKTGKLIGSIRTVLFLMVAVASIVTGKSATSLMFVFALGFFFLFFIGFRQYKNRIFTNYRVFVVFPVILFFAIIIFRVQEKFAWFITDVLGRNLTFSSRIYIWDKAIYYIKQRWWIGYGIEPQIVRIQKFGMSDAVHAHNQILELLYTGGIGLLIVFFFMIIIIGKKCMLYKKDKLSIWFLFILGTLLVMYLTEAYFTGQPLIVGMFVILYHVDGFVRIREERADVGK